VSDLEKKLDELGYGVGLRMMELISIKDRATKRETRLINMLQYLSSTIWKHLFNKVADNLERSNDNEDECEFQTSIAFSVMCCWGLSLYHLLCVVPCLIVL